MHGMGLFSPYRVEEEGGMGVMGVPQLQKFLRAPVAIDAMVP